ncbi:hypothetical protein MLD38_026728 [Melastoma candidum]|uniref:Uncharacterized protein n=1 Tax=Melastoma candidum TaxID=119954 RepID=A0ACB9P303_9MYRT|nr:hypothetical protein MLD38_026728 [Melastoma candidum]
MNTITLWTMITVAMFSSPGAVADGDTQMVDWICSMTKFTDDSIFAKALSSCMSGLMTGLVPYRTGEYPFLIQSAETELFMEADCNRVDSNDCGKCFSSIKNEINIHCKNSVGVQLHLRDCWLRRQASFANMDWLVIDRRSAPSSRPRCSQADEIGRPRAAEYVGVARNPSARPCILLKVENQGTSSISMKVSFHEGWMELFAVIIGGAEVREGKPCPEIFLAASKGLELELSKTMVIEDSLGRIAKISSRIIDCKQHQTVLKLIGGKPPVTVLPASSRRSAPPSRCPLPPLPLLCIYLIGLFVFDVIVPIYLNIGAFENLLHDS